MNRITENLSRGILFKPILGASIQDSSIAEKLAFICASAGAPLIDVRGEAAMVKAVRKGIDTAGTDTKIIASVTPNASDIHFLKASVNRLDCNGCGQCTSGCPHQAIAVIESAKAEIYTKSCRGCGHCIDICPASAITLISPPQEKTFHEIVQESIKAGADTIEFHCSGMRSKEIYDALITVIEEVRAINQAGYPISVCVGSLKSSPAEIISVVRMLTDTIGTGNFFIQADGETMADSIKGFGLQSLALVSLIRNIFPEVSCIASGGTTEATWRVAKELSIPISGIGMGLRVLELLRISENDIAILTARTLFCPWNNMTYNPDGIISKGSAWYDLTLMGGRI